MATTPSESTKPAAPKAAVAEEPVAPKLVTIQLVDAFVNNYTAQEAAALGLKLDEKGRAVFGPGQVTVAADVAEDLLRRQNAALVGDRAVTQGINHMSDGPIAHLG